MIRILTFLTAAAVSLFAAVSAGGGQRQTTRGLFIGTLRHFPVRLALEK